MKFRLIVSLVCLVPLMYISMGHMWGWPFLSVFHGAENGITFALTQNAVDVADNVCQQKILYNRF